MLFDTIDRTDTRHKRRTESIFGYWNRSARPGDVETRRLMESWFSRIPSEAQKEFRARFCSGDAALTSAFQEMCLNELFLHERCEPRLHAAINGTSKKPDFLVRQPFGPLFLLEARTSTEISRRLEVNPRSNRVFDLLTSLHIPGFRLGIAEITTGTHDLRLALLESHITRAIRAIQPDTTSAASIPTFETADGWRIRLDAIPGLWHDCDSTVLYESWYGVWNPPSETLLNAVKKKACRYGDAIYFPFVIAINSNDPMLVTRDYEDVLIGESRLWGTAAAPQYRRVSAVLFTKNLWPETLLMGQVESRLYLNPFARLPYSGVLTELDTFMFDGASWRCRHGASIHTRLGLNRRDSAFWN